MKNKILMVLAIIVIIIALCFVLLGKNKTFFKTTYIGYQNQEIFIPRFSYFQKESGMFAASFKSLRSKKSLEDEIKNYMDEFEYFENDSTYGYKKGDLFIQSYEVIDEGMFRRIVICY